MDKSTLKLSLYCFDFDVALKAMTGCNFTVDEFIVHIVLCALDLPGIHRRGKTPHQTESENDKEFGRKLFLVLLAMTVNLFLSKKGERPIGKHSTDRIRVLLLHTR